MCTRTCMVGASSILIPLGDKVASNKWGLITAALGSQKKVGFLSGDPDKKVARVGQRESPLNMITTTTPHSRDAQ